jgi:hypothetical protein
MERSKAGRAVALVLVSMVAGALAIPRVASAVGSIVTIQDGASTSKAGVNKAGQLLGGETAPASIREFRANFNGGVCKTMITVPATKGFILRELVVDLSSTGGPGNAVVLRLDDDCIGAGNEEIFRATEPAGTTVALPFEPGFALAAGTKVTLATGNLSGEVYLYGYLVPKSAVPTTTPVRSV